MKSIEKLFDIDFGEVKKKSVFSCEMIVHLISEEKDIYLFNKKKDNEAMIIGTKISVHFLPNQRVTLVKILNKTKEN